MQRKILFLYTGNSARSQMAEALLLRKYAGEDFQVFFPRESNRATV